MGWSAYPNMTAKEAVRYELQGLDILAESGAWYLCRNTNNVVFIVQALTERFGGEVAVKMIDGGMGPLGTPPRSLFARYLREIAGREVGTYEQEFIDRVKAEHARPTVSLKPGALFVLGGGIRYSDGVTETRFIYEGKYTARRASDNVRVRLPKNFRKRISA